MSSKSNTRNYFRDKLPNAFCEDALPSLSLLSKCTVAFHDSMQAIKGANVGNKANWGQFSKRVASEAEYCFNHIQSIHTFVMVFDDYNRVPLAKSVEQISRSASQSVGDGKHDLRDFCIAGLDEEIPETFNAAVRDRTKWCREIIRFCVKSMATSPEHAPPLVRPGNRLIVSGHYLTYGDLPIPVHPDAPLEFYLDDNYELQIRFRPDLAHTLGEGDLGMLFLMKALADQMPPEQTFIMFSIDSDMLYLCLKFLHKFEHLKSNILMRYWPGLTWCVNLNPYFRIPRMNPSEVFGQKWVDVGLLKEHIESLECLNSMNVEQRVPHVVTAANASGNDYIDQTRLVPGNYYLDACLEDAQAMGPLIEVGDTWELNGYAYQRLVEYAVRRAATRKPWKAEPGKNCGPGFDVPSRMPSPNDRIFRKYHLKYWLQMIDHVGEPDYNEPLLCEYGYGRNNREAPVSYRNLVRLHGDDKFDEWTDQPERPVMALPEKEKPVETHFGDLSSGEESGFLTAETSPDASVTEEDFVEGEDLLHPDVLRALKKMRQEIVDEQTQFSQETQHSSAEEQMPPADAFPGLDSDEERADVFFDPHRNALQNWLEDASFL